MQLKGNGLQLQISGRFLDFSSLATTLAWYNISSLAHLLCITTPIQTVVGRFNCGLGNTNYYLQQTMQLLIENRVPTAHLRLNVQIMN